MTTTTRYQPGDLVDAWTRDGDLIGYYMPVVRHIGVFVTIDVPNFDGTRRHVHAHIDQVVGADMSPTGFDGDCDASVPSCGHTFASGGACPHCGAGMVK